MNRIICDICGSEYPETSDRCPICSYLRQGNEKVVAASAEAVRTKVKGGRFSSKNVKKRMKARRKAETPQQERDPNKPLLLVIILLLIAILLVALYIGVRFFRGRNDYQPSRQPAVTTTAPVQTTLPPEVACEQILLGAPVLDLEQLGEQKQLSVSILPTDTTDAVTYVSADPAVAAVSETGLVTAVGSGQTTVTVTCGQISQVCTIVCWFQEETTLPTEAPVPTESQAPEPRETEPKPTEPKETEPKPTQPKPTEAPTLKLDQSDVSCFTQYEVFNLYVKLGSTSIGRSKVTWTSSDPSVVTVENGQVTAVAKGTATVTAEYEGMSASCIVRCRFDDTSWTASASDVTLGVGESFRLTVTNNSGETADVIWTMNTEGIVSVEGKTITGRAPGTVTLTTTVDDVTMSCIVRVK